MPAFICFNEHTQMTSPSINHTNHFWLARVSDAPYLPGGFLFGLHAQLINFADDILWVKVLGYLNMLPLLGWIVRETGIPARALGIRLARREQSNLKLRWTGIAPACRPHLYPCMSILTGVDVKIDNTRLWFPSGHPAYVALKAQQEPVSDSLSIEAPCAASGSPTALRSLRFLPVITYLIASSG